MSSKKVTGTHQKKYRPTALKRNESMKHICGMKTYQNYSPEELRLMDLKATPGGKNCYEYKDLFVSYKSRNMYIKLFVSLYSSFL